MNKLMNKKLTKKGFTLAELLIVVAILAILVAVSIPIFTGQLDKARISTDKANLRAAKAAVVAAYMEDDQTATGDFVKYYKAADGTVVDTFADAGKYNETVSKKSDGTTSEFEKGTAAVKVTINRTTGAITTVWANA